MDFKHGTNSQITCDLSETSQMKNVYTQKVRHLLPGDLPWGSKKHKSDPMMATERFFRGLANGCFWGAMELT